ncbi:MAG: fibronectin type III domain-containing protein [Candidatus Kerfeldbacteria bacterium]|nr:fibronectin type III domain-containing protein [Candidatus Kerfeldbacteria bacterium]
MIMVVFLLALTLATVQADATIVASPASTSLTKVTGVAVTDITTTTAEITWKKQATALQYQVRVRAGDDTVVKKKKTERRRLTVSELEPNTTYTVQVRAMRKAKTGAWSKAIAFTTVAEETTLYDEYKAVAGTSTGQWQNLTYGTSGDATTVVEIDPDGRAAFTLDLGGLVFELIDPDPKTYESTYDETGVVFTAEDDDLFGDVTITIVANGNDTAQITFTGLDVPVAGISSIAAEGTLYDDAVDLDYTITFTDSLTAAGVMNLTKL